jgi:hypothetical protein
VDEAEWHVDERPEAVEEAGMLGDRASRPASALLADDGQRPEAALPLAGHVVGVVRPVPAEVEPVRAGDDPGVELLPRAAPDDEARDVELMRDDGVPVGVQGRADDRVAVPRVADEQAEALDRARSSR